ncbi:MAG: cysteine desulfurase [Patescibacteria group bacterium]|nr:cysteine desulfurase [Patescibacteria group bacterium]
MINKKKKIYLDYAATTPLDKAILQTMLPYLTFKYGNSMSIHSFGMEASLAVEAARKDLANFLNSKAEEIFFTSGATESNNIVIKGTVDAYYKKFGKNAPKPHIVTTKFEHHSVLNAFKTIEKEDLAEVSYINISKDGFIDFNELKSKIKKPNTVLVSVVYVNSEIGTVQPIKKIGNLIKTMRKDNIYPLFHTDATQAVNYFSCDVTDLGIDFLSFSSHKIYGPKGIGALYLKKNVPLKKLFDGGEQENGFRPGTHNVAGIVGFAKAIEFVIKNKNKDFVRLKTLRNFFIDKVLEEILDSNLNGSKENRSPNNCNFRFKNIEGESLVLMLDQIGIACSTGSACSSSSLQASHVLLSIGLRPEEAHSSLRITLGRDTTKQDIEFTIEKLKQSIEKLRKLSGSVLTDYFKKYKGN